MKSILLSRLHPVTVFAVLLAVLVSADPSAVRAQVVSGKLQNLAALGSQGASLSNGPLLRGNDGSFYGTSQFGGTYGRGTVFKVTPDGVVTVLYSFSGGTDGAGPVGGVVSDEFGNLYGTTIYPYLTPSSLPSGTVFRLTPYGALFTLHQFNGTNSRGLAKGADGNFYGVAPAPLAYDPGMIYPAVVTDGDGIIFRVTPEGEYSVAYTFVGDGEENYNPTGTLSPGTDGNLYGVALGKSLDEVFRFTPGGTLRTVTAYSTEQWDGTPNSGLAQDADGNLYGTSFNGGSSGGKVFKIDQGGGLATLHTFNGNDGRYVRTGLTLGSDGNFYGVADSGGVNSNTNTTTTTGYGTIFQVTPRGVLTTLYNFSGDDGTMPQGPLLQAGDGLFYGTTSGTVDSDGPGGFFFSLKVSNQPAFFTGELALTRGVYYLQFPNTDFFGYYTFLSDPRYLYHYDLGYEYVFDANDGQGGVYLYDFASASFFYTSPTFPFPYLYDFGSESVLYYYPINFAGRYSSNPRYFYDFATGQIITK